MSKISIVQSENSDWVGVYINQALKIEKGKLGILDWLDIIGEYSPITKISYFLSCDIADGGLPGLLDFAVMANLDKQKEVVMGSKKNLSIRKEAVVGLTRSSAENHLRNYFTLEDGEHIVDTILNPLMTITNKRKIIAIPASETSRGYRFDFLHIDSNIPVRHYNEVVLPMLRSSDPSKSNIQKRMRFFN